MKPVRQLYLGLFLAYAFYVALLFLPQFAVPQKLPHGFAVLAAGLIGTIIAQIIRARKDGTTLVRLIPAIIVMLISFSHVVGLFVNVIDVPFTSDSSVFRFFFITSLVNMALSAVGFFLK